MNKIVSYILLGLILHSCSNNEPEAKFDSENPFEMEWMQDRISELQFCVCTISIFQAEYNGETVFWQLMNDPLCQGVIENISVVNCLGEEILVLENYQNWVDFNKNVTKRKIIYVCPKK